MKSSWIAVSVLLFFFLWASIGAAHHDSPTHDESLHLLVGYNYWKTGKYTIEPSHPPLSRLLQSAPLLFWNLSVGGQEPTLQPSRFANRFLFHNNKPFKEILMAGRFMTIAMAIAAGLLIWCWASMTLGLAAGFFAILTLLTCPLILAHGHLCTNDLPLGLFYMAALFGLWRFTKDPSTTKAIVAGILGSAAILTKFSSLTLLPLTGFMMLLLWRKTSPNKRDALRWSLAYTLALILCVLAIYKVTEFGALFEGLRRVGTYVQGGRASFIAGQYSTQGWPYYFAVAFLLKSTAPYLLLLFGAIVHLSKCRQRTFLLLWIYLPVGLFFAAASLSPMQIGIRHILPAYVLLSIPIGDYLQHLWQSQLWKRLIAALLAAWLLMDAAIPYPFYIASFNELIKPNEAYRYLSDSNIDWGQELGALADYLKKQKVDGIYLSYFGSAEPHAFGIRYHAILPDVTVLHADDPTLDLHRQDRVLIAVSATHLQGVYFDDHTYLSWLNTRIPCAILGHSLFIYDLTGDAEAHRKLAGIYDRVGLSAEKEFELRWGTELEQKTAK